MSTILLHNKPKKNQIIGIGIMLIGVLTTVLAVGMEANFSIVGYSMLLLAVISYALYSVFVERNTEFTNTEITYIMLASGAIIFGILGCIESAFNDNFIETIKLPIESSSFLVAIIYQSVFCSILAFFISVIYVPFLANLFELSPISIYEFAIGLGIAFLVVPIIEIIKFIQRKKQRV